VIVALDKEAIVKDLRRVYPLASDMIEKRTWSNELLKKRFPRAVEKLALKDEAEAMSDVVSSVGNEAALVVGGFEPFTVGEDVLVESRSGQLLWEASITGISKRANSRSGPPMIDAYRVQYSGWGSRYTEWVEPSRVLEANENNRLLEVGHAASKVTHLFNICLSLLLLRSQNELVAERSASRHGLPPSLNFLVAQKYLTARDRARGSAPLPDFACVAQVKVGQPSSAVTCAAVKVAMLAIEAALPIGSIDNTDNGVWRPEYARKWRKLVIEADGSSRLLQCLMHLEDVISKDWIKEDVGHLRSCLPARWKAVGESSSGALAIRAILLDRSILYSQVDKKRFSRRKKTKS
jgi:hypothetical protein